MSVHTRVHPSGKVAWRVRCREGGVLKSRDFGRKRDADAFQIEVRRSPELGDLGMLEAGRQHLDELAREWWSTYAEPNLARKTRVMYASLWKGDGVSDDEPRIGAGSSAAGWKSSIGLPEGSSSRIWEPPGPVTIRCVSEVLLRQPVHFAFDVVDDQVDAVPAAWGRPAAVLERSAGGACGAAEQEPQPPAADVGECRGGASGQREAEVFTLPPFSHSWIPMWGPAEPMDGEGEAGAAWMPSARRSTRKTWPSAGKRRRLRR